MARSMIRYSVLIVSGIAASASCGQTPDPFAHLPAKITVVGVARDFRAYNVTAGHADFEMDPPRGWGVYNMMVQDTLDQEGLPVFRSTGYKVTGHWLDSKGRRRISPRPYIQARAGDVNGVCETVEGSVCHTQQQFNQWFRDSWGVNVSNLYSIDLNRVPNTTRYFYDDILDPRFQSGNGFFAAGNGNGSPQGGNQNYHFTYVIEAEFPYLRGQGQYFTVGGANDTWAFIDGKLVIDNGGIHAKTVQTIELDRLAWLADAGVYKIKVFFAQRKKPESRLHVETDLMLRAVDPPPTSGLQD